MPNPFPSNPMSDYKMKYPSQLAMGDKILPNTSTGEPRMELTADPIAPTGSEKRWLIITDTHPDGIFAETRMRFQTTR